MDIDIVPASLHPAGPSSPMRDDVSVESIEMTAGTPPSPSIEKVAVVSTDQVFLNQDLVDKIIDCYADKFPVKSVGAPKNRGGLRQLSTLSRAFFEATSNNIWKELSSIVPLFNLLPQSERDAYVLMKPLETEDFDRWKVYSHRVRAITLQPKKPNEPHPPSPSTQALAAFSVYQATSGDILFPALQYLGFREKLTAADLVCLAALSHPSLEGLCFLAPSPSKVVLAAALHHATVSIPRLRNLTLRIGIHVESLWSILSKFSVLTTVNLMIPHAPEHVESFCSFPTLQEGVLYLSPITRSKVTTEKNEAYDLQCSIKGSPNGREINLLGDLNLLVSAIPAAVRHGVTLNLQVTSTSTRRTGACEELLNVISISSSNISNLSLRDDGAAYSIPLGALWKLMALDNLQSLILAVDCNVQPNQDEPDQIFHHLCLSAKHKAMPLTKLHIQKLSGEHLGLASLRHVSEHLPHLLDLELSFDSSLGYEAPHGLFVGTPLPRLTERHPMRCLRVVELRSSAFNIEEYRSMAVLINDLFPNLTSLKTTAAVDTLLLDEGWKLIDVLRRDYQYLGNLIVQK
ncbi:hypothetical protein BKA70DRAFT_69861 [Coprinopsis sp. MPI-PUGE-AT-0042]|nr:hypothetical protein BKA70DRAFT_69861 [Coprinopsis sp. MPI-PUGE-AT-0042]